MCKRCRIAGVALLVMGAWAFGAGSTSAAARESAAAESAAAESAAPAAVAPVNGEFVGSLGPLHLRLHLVAAADGSLSGTVDSLDQGAMGLRCADFQRDGDTLSFKVPSVGGSWTGSVDKSGSTLAGTWTQRGSQSLTFTRDDFVPAAAASPVDGFWRGTLKVPSQALRLQLVVTSDNKGAEFCTMDSLDQRAFNLACANVVYAGRKLSFDVPAVHGHWSGELSADGNALAGTWNQGAGLPLDFARQPKRWSPPAVTMGPAIAPVDAANMQSVLSGDFEQALKQGALAPGTSAGLTVGVVRKGVRRVFAFGDAQADSIYEIGSITKTFTGLVLAQMIEQGLVRVDEPVRELLPAGTVAKPPGAEISLLDLVTQHSGLPRMPDNFQPADPSNPYVDYRQANLYRYVSGHGVEKAGDPPFLYSNLGLGLLGQALADRAALSYPQLLAEDVTGPLSLRDTGVALSSAQQRRFIEGHTADHHVAHAWDLDALAGAGAIRSTADDMLTYLEAQLHPEAVVARGAAASPKLRTLPAALLLSQEIRAEAGSGMKIAFAWLYDPENGSYWHNGATGGYSSFAFFNPKGDYAAVVLMNTSVGASSYADLVGQHIAQRFAGKPAALLDN